MLQRLKQIVFILFATQLILWGHWTYASAPTNADGDLVVGETLAMRCGLDADNSDIDDDCINRLAYDYQTGKTYTGDSYEEETQQIMGDYVKHYIRMAAQGLVVASKHKDDVAKMICVDTSGDGCKSVAKDTRTEIEYCNKLATNNANLLLDAIKMQSASLNLDNLTNVIDNFVPNTDIDTSDSSLSLPPSNEGGQNE